MITLAGGGSITIDEMFAGPSTRIEEFAFTDGATTLSFDQVEDMMSQGTDGDDVIDGFPTADVLVGGRGDDLLRGGKSGDTAVSADGADTLIDFGNGDLIRLAGVLPADLGASVTSTGDRCGGIGSGNWQRGARRPIIPRRCAEPAGRWLLPRHRLAPGGIGGLERP